VLANLGARVLLEVDVVHDADTWIAEAAAARERGEVLYAEERLRAALEARQEDPASLVPLGELLIATGREAEGLTCLHRAAMGPSGHPDVLLAAELLARHPT
jgi:Flp pilus assembly protein TadD